MDTHLTHIRRLAQQRRGISMSQPAVRRERAIGVLPNLAIAIRKRTDCSLSSSVIRTHAVRFTRVQVGFQGEGKRAGNTRGRGGFNPALSF